MKTKKKTISIALMIVFGSLGCAGLFFQRSTPTGTQGPEAEQLTDRIEKLFEAHDILRLKGFAAIQGREMRLLVQGVGTRLNTYFDRDWRSDETRTTRLVVIGLKSLDQSAIESILRG